MSRKQQPEVQSFSGATEQWYMAGEAAKVLSANSKRKVGPEYLYKLGSMGKLRTKKLGTRVTLYCKADVDAYRVEPRGIRSGAAKREKYGIAPGVPTIREQRRQAKEQPAQQGESEKQIETLA